MKKSTAIAVLELPLLGAGIGVQGAASDSPLLGKAMSLGVCICTFGVFYSRIAYAMDGKTSVAASQPLVNGRALLRP